MASELQGSLPSRDADTFTQALVSKKKVSNWIEYETPISEPRVEERGGEKPEKRGGERPGKDYTAFFPASVVESRKYSPHFLLGHRARLRRGSSAGVPSGSPLLELQPRQAETAGPSRKAGKAADNKRREKISNRTPVPFEPQETRPKVPDMDEQDANEENDASALLKGRSFTPAFWILLVWFSRRIFRR
eukprot:symbB.v1.2.021233.t1/scaffold1818.1/size102009/7